MKIKTISNSDWQLLFIAWAISVLATLGAVFIGEIMGQVPCNLCWYQRIFMFPLSIILTVAAYRSDLAVWRYALPLSLLGVLFSAFHSLIYFKILPEQVKPCMATGPSCSGEGMMLWGTFPLPVLSLAAFVIISISMILIMKRSSK